MSGHPHVEFLFSLPLGTMIAVDKSFSVDGFLEVNGQELQKSEHTSLFDVLKGNVIDNDSTFVLPSRSHIQAYFSDFDPDTMKIIIKVQ